VAPPLGIEKEQFKDMLRSMRVGAKKGINKPLP